MKNYFILKELIKMSPNKATLLIDNQENEVNINEVKCGDYFIVKTGDNIPLDGIVVKGNGTVNESILTGESLPIDKNIEGWCHAIGFLILMLLMIFITIKDIVNIF